MSVPDFQSIMLPLLKVVANGKQWQLTAIREELARSFHLSPDERRELLPSGMQRVFDNRVAWAKTYLIKAKLLEAPQRGQIKITDRGLNILTEKPGSISVGFLKRFPEFNEFIAPNDLKPGQVASAVSPDERQTPIEKLDNAVRDLNQKLAVELLDYIREMDSYKFEILVIDLLQAMGYGGNREEAAQVTKKSGDGGIDGIINEDRLGLDKIYVQAKKWEGTVTISAIRDFGGTLLAHSAQKGIFITTSDFPRTAIDYCERIDRTIILINGKRLTELMIEYNVGVSAKKTYVVKEVDSDYFES